MADRRSDVLVIGAGPAGLVTAGLLARAGHRVTVVESRLEPSPGVLCLTTPGAEVLQELDAMAEMVERPSAVRSKELWLEGAAQQRIQLCERCAVLALSRAEALEVLERSAYQRGVTLIKGFTACGPLWQDRRVIGIRARDGQGDDFVFEAPVVVDATGPRGFLPAALGQAMPRRGPRRVRVVARLDGEPPGEATLAARGGHWLLVVPVDGGMVNAVLRVPDDADPTTAWASEVVNRELGDRWHAMDVAVDTTSLGGAMRAVAGDGWVAVGAAAGCGAPGFPGGSSAGLVVASSAAWEAHLALRDGKVFTGGSAGATVTLARQRVHLETLLERALSRASRARMLEEACSGRRRVEILTSMLEGRWAESGGRLRRLLYLWWLDHRSRRLMGRMGEEGNRVE
ncbi:MAG: FAD-dependent monooxygenase [Acidobacteria bacterium]|nr:FAD-dependent monooxygenase [Acidobacteriota bacterium]